MRSPIRYLSSMFLAAAVLGPISSASAGAPTPAPAAPAPADDAAARFESFLRSIDVVPPDRASLEATFPDAWTRLDAAARDASRDTWTRVRAVSLLSYFPEARTRGTLEALAKTSENDPELRRQAIYTLGRGFGPLADAGLVRFIAGFASDKAPAVREHAVRSLRWVDAKEAELALADLVKRGPVELRELAKVTLDKRAKRLAAPRLGH